MSTSISTQISSDALFEQILAQKLKEHDDHYLHQIRAHEEEAEARRMRREQEFQVEIATHHATLESLSRQLEDSRVDQL